MHGIMRLRYNTRSNFKLGADSSRHPAAAAGARTSSMPHGCMSCMHQRHGRLALNGQSEWSKRHNSTWQHGAEHGAELRTDT